MHAAGVEPASSVSTIFHEIFDARRAVSVMHGVSLSSLSPTGSHVSADSTQTGVNSLHTSGAHTTHVTHRITRVPTAHLASMSHSHKGSV